VKRAAVQARATGSLERKPIPGYPRRIGPEQEAALRARLEAAADATVLEHCVWWAQQHGQQLSEATMWRAIRRLGWTPKKRHWQEAERDEQARTAWREAAASLDSEQLVFVDESGTNIALIRLYGWAPHDRRATGLVPRNHGKNTTVVAALAPDGLHVPWLSASHGRCGLLRVQAPAALQSRLVWVESDPGRSVGALQQAV
jgi:transposase